MTGFSVYKEAARVLKESKRPLFVVLKDVDADAMGSAMALARSLALSGAKPTGVSRGEVPPALRFLLDPLVPFVENAEQLPADFDSMVIGDTGQLGRSGFADEIEAAVKRGVPLLNIDHHHIHQAFGTINLIDEKASATAELVYDLLKLGNWPIDAQVATGLLAGIVADTDNFTNAGTTIRSLEIAASCYAKGAEVRRVIRELYQGRELNALKLWGEILTRLKKHKRYGLVSTVILQDDFEQYDISEEAAEGLANFMNTIADMKAAMILKELPGGEIRASLRSTRDDVDVSKIAKLFGGGGHKKAAGFTIPGKIVRRGTGWHVESSAAITAPTKP